MSFYNMINGVNQSTFYILPMLGEKHPEEYPRFRDCHVTEEGNIAVYTRVGGNNRNDGYGEEELYKHPNFIKTYDDEFDSTYATYEFSVPDEWKEDFDKIMNGNILSTSQAYRDRLYKVFPNLKNQFDEFFSQ